METDADIVHTAMKMYLATMIFAKLPMMSKQRPSVNEVPKEERHFFLEVYDVVRQIPKGRVTSYGAIASFLGTRLSARMVGWAMNAAHAAKPKVPAQRVVNRNGMLTGRLHFKTPSLMEELLEKEGVKIEDNKVVNFEAHFWDPAKELSLDT